MYRKATPLFMVCQTPLHAGSGSELGIVDLPIQRERHTGFPKIEGSSLKGAIREAFERRIYSDPATNKTFESLDAADTRVHRAFGYDDGSLTDGQKKQLKKLFKKKDKEEYTTDFAGCVGFSDARLLLFPIKSMKGVFAWATCPRALQQFAEDMKLSEKDSDLLKKVAGLTPKANQCITVLKNELTVEGKDKKHIILEEYAFKVEEESEVLDELGAWLSENILPQDTHVWTEKLKKDLVVLPNDDFKDFVHLSTEVITRTRIDNATGTVAQGALFTEEYLPAESIMYSLVLTAAEFKAEERMEEQEIRDFFAKQLPKVCQIGGSATLGKGMVYTKLIQ